MSLNACPTFALFFTISMNTAFSAPDISPRQPPAKVDLTIEIQHLHSNQGKIMALLFRAAKGFPDDAINAHRQGMAQINEKTSEIVFRKLEPGNYAIALFHDENDDSKLNKHWYGKPEEGVATSNNIIPRFGAPSYEDCQFTINSDMKIVLNMHYFD